MARSQKRTYKPVRSAIGGLSVETALTSVAESVADITAYRDEAQVLLTGGQKAVTYNQDPPAILETIRLANGQLESVISHANAAIEAASALKYEYEAMLADGYPQQPTFSAEPDIVENLTEDLAQQEQFLAQFQSIPEATNGEILEEEETP